jgi:diketogulonate reductase-like aldo/keto reductase
VALAPIRSVRGYAIPSFLYGTAWKEERTRELTAQALTAGFRGIDTANQRKHYFEAAVGEAVIDALGRGEVTRAELFLQSKFTGLGGQDKRLPYDAKAEPALQVAQSFASSLEHFATSYLDSYVLHGPSANVGLTEEDVAVWRAMEALAQQGKTRLLGISNVSREQLELLLDVAEIPPAFVQNRCYARTGWDARVRECCETHDIVYQGFSLLTANRRELDRPEVRRIVERSGRTLPEVVFRFALELGMLPLTGTSDPAHMRLDLDCFELELDRSELRTLLHVARA